jgi:hypothetical protein
MRLIILLITAVTVAGLYDNQEHLHDPKTAFENLARIGNEELSRLRKARAATPAAPALQDLSFLRDLKFTH